jgi:hypothetical protein
MSDYGFKAPSNLGVPERTPVNNQVHRRWDTFAEEEAKLHMQGFTDADKPLNEFPQLTAQQLTTLPNDQYTALHATYLEWFRYTAEIFAKLKANILQLDNEMEDIELTIKRDMKGGRDKKPTADDLEIAVGTTPRYVELKQLKQRAEQAKILLETRVDYLERSLRVISRQVELRKIDAGQGMVNNGMPARGRGNFPTIRGPGQ